MNNVFIYGGCVSRDIFSPEYNSGGLNLVNYVARTSIAKLADQPVKIEVDKQKVKSPFQRKLLKNDGENNLLSFIEKSDFDFFLMDFMYLMYRLISYKNTWLTYSNELKKSGIITASSRMLSYNDTLFWEKFEAGIQLLFSCLDRKKYLPKILINQLYLATHDEQGVLLVNQEYIERFNAVLDKTYSYMQSILNPDQFVNYDRALFTSNSTHKWGADPMHYIDDFYEKSYLEIASKESN